MFATSNTADSQPPSNHRDSSINFEGILRMLDAAPQKMVERSRFTLDGLTYEVRRVPFDGGTRFVISVTIGYLPFSIESAERREIIKTIVRASSRLPRVRFDITASSRITAGGVFEVASPAAPNYIFYPLTLFVQEARPFMSLLGQYLLAAPTEAAAESA